MTTIEQATAGEDAGITFGSGKKHRGGTLKQFSEAVRKAVQRKKCSLPRWNQRRFGLKPAVALPQGGVA